MTFNQKENELLIDKAHNLVQRGGLSGASLDFLEGILWHGFSPNEETSHFEHCRMREITQLHGV